MTKLEVLQKLRECAKEIKGWAPTQVPDNSHRMEPGLYEGDEMAAVVYFIADMLE